MSPSQQHDICRLMGSTYNPTLQYIPTHVNGRKTCMVMQRRFFDLLGNDAREIDESEYVSLTKWNQSHFASGARFDPSLVIEALEIVYNPTLFQDKNHVIVFDITPVKLDDPRQVKRMCDRERVAFGAERVNNILQVVELNYKNEHLCGSEGSPTTKFVSDILFEVDGNEDDCIELCIERMVENQRVRKLAEEIKAHTQLDILAAAKFFQRGWAVQGSFSGKVFRGQGS